jgi:hypothetical protein
MINKPIVKILTPLYTVVYVQGNKFEERQEIIDRMWIRLGMHMAQANLNLLHIHRVFITPEDCSNEADKNLILSGGFPEHISMLSDNLRALIFESRDTSNDFVAPVTNVTNVTDVTNNDDQNNN